MLLVGTVQAIKLASAMVWLLALRSRAISTTIHHPATRLQLVASGTHKISVAILELTSGGAQRTPQDVSGVMICTNVRIHHAVKPDLVKRTSMSSIQLASTAQLVNPTGPAIALQVETRRVGHRFQMCRASHIQRIHGIPL